MPSIVAQRIDESGIYIQSSDGREISLTKDFLRGKTPAEAALAIETVFGADQLPAACVKVELDSLTGTPISLEILSSPPEE